jgi:hypothetical protein
LACLFYSLILCLNFKLFSYGKLKLLNGKLRIWYFPANQRAWLKIKTWPVFNGSWSCVSISNEEFYSLSGNQRWNGYTGLNQTWCLPPAPSDKDIMMVHSLKENKLPTGLDVKDHGTFNLFVKKNESSYHDVRKHIQLIFQLAGSYK